MTEPTATNELVMTRIFNAPRELVYKAFVDPDQLAQWFGPIGYSVPRDTIDVDARVGGHQRLTMVNDKDPNEKSPVNATFIEVVPNELLVGREEWEGTSLTLRLEFHEENGGKTRLELRQGPFSEEMAQMTRDGWGSSFTKLDALLAG